VRKYKSVQLRQYLLGGTTGVAGQVELKQGHTVEAGAAEGAGGAGADKVVAVETIGAANIAVVETVANIAVVVVVTVVATDVDVPANAVVVIVVADVTCGKADECGG
jgi:hypothetical protein